MVYSIRRVGRARDQQIDVRVLAAAKRHLARHGYDAMSVAAVAQEAGTTRQALYRRWPTKAELAAAAVDTIDDLPPAAGPEASPAGPDVSRAGRGSPASGSEGRAGGPDVSTAGSDTRAGGPDVSTAGSDAPAGGPDPLAAGSDPLAALVAELQNFAAGVSRPGRMSLVGAMLQETVDPGVVERYRARIIAPRRARILAVLRDARELGLIDGDADLEVAATMCTGSWYGRALAGDPPPPDWPRRAATLVWRAVGGR